MRRATIKKITRAYIRKYSDNGQTVAYVEWIDTDDETGRTEGKPDNAHMQALLARAEREGIAIEREQWLATPNGSGQLSGVDKYLLANGLL